MAETEKHAHKSNTQVRKDEDVSKRDPVFTKEEAQKMYRRSIEETQSALDLDVPQGVFEYIKAPSVVVVGVLLAYLIGRLGFSILFLAALVYAIIFKFRRSMAQFKVSLQALVYNQARKEKALNNWESVEWINYVVGRFWPVVEKFVSEEVFRNVNTFFYENCPPFLRSIRLTEFTLGSQPPKITGIMFYESTGDDTVQLDVELFFIPLETSKETHMLFERPSSRAEYNSRVVLVARLGMKSHFGVDLPILMKKIAFRTKLRVILSITKRSFFVREVEACMLEEPYIDFTLKPLKAVDLMDLPGLSNWINNIIISGLRSNLINPQSLKINLEKLLEAKAEALGVLCLQLLDFESRQNEKCHGEIDIDGRRLYATGTREGARFSFSEFFYLSLSNVDDFVNFNLVAGGQASRGSLHVKKIMGGSRLETMRIIGKEGTTKATLHCAMCYYPILKAEGKRHMASAALVTMTIVQIENLHAMNAPRGAYTTACTVIVSPEKPEQAKKEESSLPLIRSVGSTMIASLDVMSWFSKRETLPPATRNTFFVYKTKTIVDSNSPKFGEKCTFLSRNIAADAIRITVVNRDGEDTSVLANLEIPVANVFDGMKEWYRLRDAKMGRMELQFNMSYIELAGTEQRFKDYKKVLQISLRDVSTIYGSGCYSAMVRTRSGAFPVDTFAVGIVKLDKRVLVPVEDRDDVELFLYRENLKDEIFVGSGFIMKDGVHVALDTSVNESVAGSELAADEGTSSVFLREVAIRSSEVDTGSVLVTVEEENLKEYKGVSDSKDEVKIIQARFSSVQGLEDDFVIEFRNSEEIVACSAVSSQREIQEVFTFVTGREDIRAWFRSLVLGKDIIVGECAVPKRKMNEKVLLSETGVFCMVEVRVQCARFWLQPSLKRGCMKLTVNSVQDLRSPAGAGPCDSFCKVFINNTQVHRTKIVKKQENPVFNEEVYAILDKRYDILKIAVQDWSQFEASHTLGVVETPLHFLDEGVFSHRLKLLDPSTLKHTGSCIDLTFCFSRDEAPQRRRKNNSSNNNIFSAFLSF
eukprot:jgi/Antlo1/1793/734